MSPYSTDGWIRINKESFGSSHLFQHSQEEEGQATEPSNLKRQEKKKQKPNKKESNKTEKSNIDNNKKNHKRKLRV